MTPMVDASDVGPEDEALLDAIWDQIGAEDSANYTKSMPEFDPNDPNFEAKQRTAQQMMTATGDYLAQMRDKTMAQMPRIKADPGSAEAIRAMLAGLPPSFFESQGFVSALTAILQDAGLEAGQELIRRLGLGEIALTGLDAASMASRIADELATTTRASIDTLVQTWMDMEGATIGDLVDAMQASMMFSPDRALLTAITETTRAYAEGQQAAASDLAGQLNMDAPTADNTPPVHPGCRCWLTIEAQKDDAGLITGLNFVWHTNRDDIVCPMCAPLDGRPA